jgi:hypothetical protein
MGIEPTSEAWEASILPLYDARSEAIVPANWPAGKRREHRSTGWNPSHRVRRYTLADRAGCRPEAGGECT